MSLFYDGGGDYSVVRPRTVIARSGNQIHLITTVNNVTIVQLKDDLEALGYSISSTVNLDGGGSSQMKWQGTTYEVEDRAVPFMIKLK